MEPITQAAASGLSQIQQLGIAGIMLSFLLTGGIFAIWYFARHCEKRTDAAIEAHKEESRQTREVVSKNTEAFHGVQVTLARIETRLDK